MLLQLVLCFPTFTFYCFQSELEEKNPFRKKGDKKKSQCRILLISDVLVEKGKGILEPLSWGEQDKTEIKVKVFEWTVLTQECKTE